MKQLAKVFPYRLFAVVISLLLVLTMMTACTGAGGGNTSGDDATSNSEVSGGSSGNNSTRVSVKSALKKGSNEKLNLGGKTLTVSLWGDVAPEGSSVIVDRRNARARLTEKKYNVKIEWKATNNNTFVQDMALAFASKTKFADLIFTPSTQGFDVCRLGAIVPLDDYIDFSSEHYSIAAQGAQFVDGKHYSWMPNEEAANSIGYFITYNTTLLEQAGCPDPYTLYQEGKWDWNAFADIVKKTTIVADDGTVTQFGVGGSNLLNALCISNGTNIINMDAKAHKFTCGLYTPAGLNTMDFMKKLYWDLKGVDTHYGNAHNSVLTFRDSKAAMIVCPSYYPVTFIQAGMSVHSVPMPIGPDAGGKSVNGMTLQEWWTVGAISDFSVQDALQVALDLVDNNPEYEGYTDEKNGAAVYQTEEEIAEEFVNRLYDECVFSTMEEAEFYRDFIHDKNIVHTLDRTTANITLVLRDAIVKPIQRTGADPRALLESQKPVIEEALKDMLPDSLKK